MADDEKKLRDALASLLKASEEFSGFGYDPTSRNPHHHDRRDELRRALHRAHQQAREILGATP